MKTPHPLLLLGVGTGFMALSVVLISAHIHTIIQVRDVSVPIVAQLPQMERKLSALKQQVELAEMQTVNRAGSQQEKVDVYALPKETDMSRLIATFEVIRDVLKRDGVLASMSDIDVSDADTHILSVEFSVHEEGLQSILLLVRLAGLLTVSDVLTEQEIALLVDRVEQENPTGIIALEQFLSLDLLRYAEDPQTFEEQLKRSFTSSSFLNAFENVLRTSLLYDTKKLLGGTLGKVLEGYKLWPMQMMALDSVTVQPGSAPKWYKLTLTVLVFSNESTVP